MGPELVELAGHDDVRHGFCMYFDNRPDIHLVELEEKVNDMIAKDLPIAYVDENHISIGGELHKCNGPRIQVGSTGQIKGFRLMHHFIYDRLKHRYYIVGCVGERSDELLKQLDVAHQRPFME